MPGATMVSNTRDTRSSRSRFSSPQVNNRSPNANGAAEQSSKGHATDSQKAFMAKWLEPPVSVKPSYQDAGLMRHGVVEGMAPLGTLPKVGIFKKTTAPATPGSAPPQNTPPPTRIVVKPRAKPTATPNPAPAPITPAAQTEDDTEEVDTEESESGAEDEALIAPPPLPRARRRSLRSQDDNAYAPGGSRAISVGTRSVNTRRSSSRAVGGKISRISLTSPSMQHTQTSASSVSRVMESIRDVADKVFEAAVNEAVQHYRHPTAWALQNLYAENCDKDEFLSMVQEIFTKSADAETVAEFTRMLKAKKKEGKKGNKGYQLFTQDPTRKASTPPEPKPAPHHNSVDIQAHEPDLPSEQTISRASQEQEQKPEMQAQPEPEIQQAAMEPLPEEPQEQAQEDEPQMSKRKRLTEEPQPSIEETPSKKQRRNSVGKHSESATPAQKVSTPKVVVASNGKKKHGGTPATGNGKAKLTESPSMRRKARAASIASSTSSLSSARSLTPPDGIMDSDEEADVSDVPPSPSPAAETVNNANAPEPPQPMARPKRNNAPKKKRNVSPTTTPAPSSPAVISTTTNNLNNTTTTRSSKQQQQQQSAAQAAASSMPALIEPPVFPNLLPPNKSAYKAAGAQFDKGIPVFPSRVGRLDDNDAKIILRQKAKKVTNGLDLSESFERGSDISRKASEAADAAAAGRDVPRPRSSRPSVFTEAPTGNLNAASRSTRSSRKRSHDEVDDEVSPTASHFTPGALDVGSSATNSRAATPILRPAKKAKTGARVKQSPMKKKNGTSAGIPRPSGERSSPAPNGAVQDENDDYCSSCGGNGELLCCDGCTRAFHLTCVDPPLLEDSMQDEWYCNVCQKARNGFGPHSGSFGRLLETLDPKNSSAFRLPLHIREYFEGVQTGVDGEYEPIVAVQKPSHRKKKVDEEVPDFFRLRDNEGNPVLCHQCDRPTSDDRPIIPCSVCGLWWHIDCLDPPLAQPPPLRTWKCPAHVEDLLGKIPGVRGPAHRFRKIKGAGDITPAYGRGYVNNGWIEVVDHESEDESGYKDRNTFGRVIRLEAAGIEKDFLYKIRKNRKGKPIPPLSAASVCATQGTVADEPIDPRELERQQAALNLAQLSGKNGHAGIDTLVDTLLTEADPSVVSLMARANPQHIKDVARLNGTDVAGLRGMLAHLETMHAQVKELLMARGELATDQPAPKSAFDALLSNLPAGGDDRLEAAAEAAADADDADAQSKDLPSPPVTDLPDEKTQGNDDPAQDSIAVATSSPPAEVDKEEEGGRMDVE